MSDSGINLLQTDKTRAQPVFLDTLKVKLTLYLLALIILLIISTFAVLSYTEKNMLYERDYEFSKQLGNTIVAELGQKISLTESLTKSIARMSESLEPNKEMFKSIRTSLFINNKLVLKHERCSDWQGEAIM